MPNYIVAYYVEEIPKMPEDPHRHMEKFQQWAEALGDALIDPGMPLGDTYTISTNGIASTERESRLSGFSIIESDSIESALEMAKSCPHVDIGTIDVAEIMGT